MTIGSCCSARTSAPTAESSAPPTVRSIASVPAGCSTCPSRNQRSSARRWGSRSPASCRSPRSSSAASPCRRTTSSPANWRVSGTAAAGRFPCPVTLRAAYGGGVRTPELHADSLEAPYTHAPGLTVVVPSNAADAKGLLASAVRADDPVIVFEPIPCYRTAGEVPDGEHLVPLGQAREVRPGDDAVIVTWGAMVDVAVAAADVALEQRGRARRCDRPPDAHAARHRDHRARRRARRARRRAARGARHRRVRRRGGRHDPGGGVLLARDSDPEGRRLRRRLAATARGGLVPSRRGARVVEALDASLRCLNGMQYLLPDLGEGMTEAELVQWRVAVGDHVTRDQIVAHVQTDKAEVELPVPAAGTIVALGADGRRPRAGRRAPAGARTPTPAPRSAARRSAAPRRDDADPPPRSATSADPTRRSKRRRRSGSWRASWGSTSPPSSVPVRADASPPPTCAPTAIPAAHSRSRPADRREPLRGVRRAMARNMAEAWRAVPHISLFDEIDARPLLDAHASLAHDGERHDHADRVLRACRGGRARGVPDPQREPRRRHRRDRVPRRVQRRDRGGERRRPRRARRPRCADARPARART